MKDAQPTFPEDWEFTFALNGMTALERIHERRFDAVVTRFEIRDVDGRQLLTAAYDRDPTTLRLLRGKVGQTDSHEHGGQAAPYVLPEELEPIRLCHALDRYFWLGDLMQREGLKALMGRIRRLPTLPNLYAKVVAELSSPVASMESVAQLIAQDPVMAAKMLQVVNSAYFGLPREITMPAEAVMYLGGERTKSLILITHLFTQFDDALCPGFELDVLWNHSVATATLCRCLIMRETSDGRLGDLAFTSGLLHDIGKLLLAANVPDQYRSVLAIRQKSSTPVWRAEKDVFGITHAELGASVLGLWGLPLPLLQAVAWHHTPSENQPPGFQVVTSVHVANALDHERNNRIAEALIDRDYLGAAGLLDRINRWREACGCPVQPDDEPAADKIQRRRDAKHN
jgi:HD-like signal output (HDOD) protein